MGAGGGVPPHSPNKRCLLKHSLFKCCLASGGGGIFSLGWNLSSDTRQGSENHSWLKTALLRVRAHPIWNLSVHMLLNDCHVSNAGLGICAQLVCFTRTRISYSLNSPRTQGNYLPMRFGL